MSLLATECNLVEELKRTVLSLSDSEQLLSVDFDWDVSALLCVHHFYIGKRVKCPILNSLHLLLEFNRIGNPLASRRSVTLTQ